MANEVLHATTEAVADVWNRNLTEAAAMARSRQLYYILVLLLEGPALQLVRPVGVREGYRAWRILGSSPTALADMQVFSRS